MADGLNRILNAEKKRLVDAAARPEEQDMEKGLRPQTFDRFVGQEELKENLKIFIAAAKGRGEALDHMLFYGPPGLGKTTLAGIIANEMGASLKVTTGPSIEKPGDLVAILCKLKDGDVLFIDEIHRIPRQVEEVLYSAMEDFTLDIAGKEDGNSSVHLKIHRFTLIGATTRPGMLSAPLRDRFGMVNHLEFYTKAELTQIVRNSAEVLGIEIEDEGAEQIGSRSRGTPRLANRLLKRVRDFAQVKGDGHIDEAIAVYALDALKVDPKGLDSVDRKLLFAIMDYYGGGPVGLETLAASIGEDSGTLEDVCEPYLMQQGLLQRTPRGRMVTDYCLKYFGREAKERPEQMKL